MKFQIVHGPISPEIFNLLCRSVGWKEVDPVHFATAVARSIACVHAVLDKEVVGFGRIVGDQGLYLYIQDLMVRASYQRQGIGEALLRELHTIAASLEGSRKQLLLIADNVATGFYKRYGYVDTGEQNRLLRLDLSL